MGVLPNSIYASEAFLPISFRAADFLQIYVPFMESTEKIIAATKPKDDEPLPPIRLED
jgi:hypothetical protein